jgi:hypothetical protein
MRPSPQPAVHEGAGELRPAEGVAFEEEARLLLDRERRARIAGYGEA